MYSCTSTVKKFENEYFYKFSKISFLVVTAQNLSQKHKRILFFSVSGMLRRRTTAGDNFLTSYTQNYCYILSKLGTLTLKASARFLRVGKNLGMQKLQIAHCCKKYCCSRRKMFNSKTEQRISLKFLVKFKL